LTDLSIARRIADTVDACPDLPVLEVGPGMGVMTKYLMQKPRPLKVVELDEESVEYLRRTYPDFEDNIIADDFLKMHLDRTFQGGQFVLTGNYPYNISSQIFFKMLDYKDYIPCCTGMIQKEVAERIAAAPNCKAYGILSVLLQAFYDIEYLFTVHEHVFDPPPKVKSAVIRMKRNGVKRLDCDEALFIKVVKTAFNQRRKMLRNSLSLLVPKDSALMSEPIATKRPEQLSVQDFILLTNRVQEELKKKLKHATKYSTSQAVLLRQQPTKNSKGY
jgi:16S rRNA (adenine1518-N6/adenine1519-N6)-dimethyltransferase